MATVTRYRVRFNGTSNGYKNNRATISLYKGQTLASQNRLGYIAFHDAGMTFLDDIQLIDGFIIMHLPSAMLVNVLDVLRNEKPINFFFESGHAFLGTSTEPVGEEE
jgi:hypothetical protein